MKIVDRSAFLSMPAGTVFAKVSPHGLAFDGLAIKDDTAGADFWIQELLPWPQGCGDTAAWVDAVEGMLAGASSAPLNYAEIVRDGLYEEIRFAVLEPADLRGLIERLETAERDLAEARTENELGKTLEKRSR